MAPRRPLVAAIAAVALTVSACGGADEPSDAGATTTGPSAPGVADTETTAPSTVASDPVPSTDPSDGPGDADPGSTAPPPDGSVSPGPVDRSTLPEVWQLVGPSIDGGTIDLAELSDRPVLLWFWAPF